MALVLRVWEGPLGKRHASHLRLVSDFKCVASFRNYSASEPNLGQIFRTL